MYVLGRLFFTRLNRISDVNRPCEHVDLLVRLGNVPAYIFSETAEYVKAYAATGYRDEAWRREMVQEYAFLDPTCSVACDSVVKEQ